MKFPSLFREDRILREQVSLIYKNYAAGIIGYFIVCVLSVYVLSKTKPSDVNYYWLAACAVVAFIPVVRSLLIKDKAFHPRREAIKQLIEIFSIGIVWAFFPLAYADGNNTIVMVMIIGFSTGLASGALAMLAPCLPVFFAFAYPNLLSLVISLFLLDSYEYYAIGIAGILYLVALTVFALNNESIVTNSIKLRFENIDLIDQLRDAIDQAEIANQAKSVFLASASHDLRQPTHAIGLFLETLSRTRLDTYQKEIISHIQSASMASGDMLDTLLNFSKLDAGVIKTRPKPFHLQPLFNKLENELGITSNEKNILYRTRETTAAANTDPSLVELILRNLVSNAIKYTKTGGILVGCRKRHPDTLVIEVWDTGIGIPLKQQKNIFLEFFQLDNPERDRHKGFGLGLAIAKGLADTMGLKLMVSSVPGSGSVFRLHLPEAEISVIKDIPDNKTLPDFKGKQVLFIDDDEDIRVAMRELLLSWDCECLVAESADEGLALVNNNTPDLLIVDYRLRQGKTGRDALLKIREALGTHIPAIIITGDTGADRLREAQSSDAFLLHKPVSAMILQRTMANAFNNP